MQQLTVKTFFLVVEAFLNHLLLLTALASTSRKTVTPGNFLSLQSFQRLRGVQHPSALALWGSPLPTSAVSSTFLFPVYYLLWGFTHMKKNNLQHILSPYLTNSWSFSLILECEGPICVVSPYPNVKKKKKLTKEKNLNTQETVNIKNTDTDNPLESVSTF